MAACAETLLKPWSHTLTLATGSLLQGLGADDVQRVVALNSFRLACTLLFLANQHMKAPLTFADSGSKKKKITIEGFLENASRDNLLLLAPCVKARLQAKLKDKNTLEVQRTLPFGGFV